MSDRKKIIYAIVGSLILHVIIILGSSKVIALWPEVPLPEQKVDETPPQMTMLDTRRRRREEQKQERQYLRTNDNQKTDQKPADPCLNLTRTRRQRASNRRKERRPCQPGGKGYAGRLGFQE